MAAPHATAAPEHDAASEPGTVTGRETEPETEQQTELPAQDRTGLQTRTTRAHAREAVAEAEAEIKAHRRDGPSQLSRVLHWLVELWQPPEIWDERRPSLRDVWRYAEHGQWTGPITAGRSLGKAYARLVAMPAHVVAYLVLWLVERPARLVFTVVFLTVFRATPPGDFCADAAAWLLRAYAGFLSPTTTEGM